MKISSFIFCALFLVACATEPHMKYFVGSGKLVASNPLSCVDMAAIDSSTDTAADIVAGAIECAKRANFDRATELFMVASAFAHIFIKNGLPTHQHIRHSILFLLIT